MPRQIVKDNVWHDRFVAADKYYSEWEKLFKCKILELYYEGQQWKSQRELGYNPYVINKVYETIQIKIAEFIPTFPRYEIASRPANSSYDLEEAANSAQLKEDTLNTVIMDQKQHFKDEIEMAYKDSFFRFGMLEVDYAADWILNPNAPKPLLGKDTDKQMGGENKHKIKKEPEELPVNERIYFKHIGASRFRVGGLDHKYLERCGWCGYYEFVNRDDLLSLKGLMNVDKVESASGGVPESELSESVDRNSNKYKPNALKIWHIWDLRAQLRLVILDSPCATLFQRKFKRLNLFDFRPDRRLITEGFYPIPPAFHWLSPQDEINETREMLRTHRRRFIRKFQVREGMMDDEEIEKFETGPDGAVVKTKGEGSISPIENATLGPELAESLQTSGADINTISGTSDEDRQVSDRSTATQANILNNRASIRMNADRDKVVAWLAGIGREALLTMRDKFTLGTWALMSSQEGEKFLGEVSQNPQAYKWVTSEDLNDGYDFRIDVDVTSLSSTAKTEQKQNFLAFLGVLNQFPQIAFSPLLVREAAYRMGYRNEKAIQEMQKMALLMEMGRMKQLGAQAGVGTQPQGGNAGQQIVANQTPPDAAQTQNQIQNQLPNMVQ